MPKLCLFRWVRITFLRLRQNLKKVNYIGTSVINPYIARKNIANNNINKTSYDKGGRQKYAEIMPFGQIRFFAVRFRPLVFDID